MLHAYLSHSLVAIPGAVFLYHSTVNPSSFRINLRWNRIHSLYLLFPKSNPTKNMWSCRMSLRLRALHLPFREPSSKSRSCWAFLTGHFSVPSLLAETSFFLTCSFSPSCPPHHVITSALLVSAPHSWSPSTLFPGSLRYFYKRHLLTFQKNSLSISQNNNFIYICMSHFFLLVAAAVFCFSVPWFGILSSVNAEEQDT